MSAEPRLKSVVEAWQFDEPVEAETASGKRCSLYRVERTQYPEGRVTHSFYGWLLSKHGLPIGNVNYRYLTDAEALRVAALLPREPS